MLNTAKGVGRRALILVDEAGSGRSITATRTAVLGDGSCIEAATGTDPQQGAALARAMLEAGTSVIVFSI